MNAEIKIIDFEPHLAQYFARLNYEWLEKYFTVEPHDREMLDQPTAYIIEPGGQIFFAVEGKDVVGTVALIVENEQTLELAKMGVKPAHQGKGIGGRLVRHAIDKARASGKSKLVLESSRKLENAIHLYRKFGFTEVEMTGCSPYSRCDIRMEMEL